MNRIRKPTRTVALSTWTTERKAQPLSTATCNCGNSAVICTSRQAPVVAPQRACPSPCQRTATAEPPLFTAMLDQETCMAQQRACQPPCSRSESARLDQSNMPGTTTGMSTSLSKKSGPEHLRDLHKFSELSGTRAPVIEHNGHDNLVQEQHLGDLHGKCTVCTVRTCSSRRENCKSMSLHEAATSATLEELQQLQFHGLVLSGPTSPVKQQRACQH